jgi:predicted NAD/FAD-binding protein
MASQTETVEVLTNAKVVDISRTPADRFLLTCADGRKVRVDDLVLASSGPATLRLLNGVPGTGEQQTALRGIEFERTRIAIHTDPAYAPTDPNHRSFLNCQIHRSYCEASMWLAKVLTPKAPQTEVNLWKSWVTFRNQQPKNLLHESTFRHMVPSVATLQAQTRLRAAQGRGGVWVAGGYTFPFDAQETALQSALDIAIGLNLSSPRISALL